MQMVLHNRVDLTALLTHRFALEDIDEAFDVFSHQRGGVMKVALYPAGLPQHQARALGTEAHARA
jgi:threonine dehydrogenase-like Zn-dependent dehydrogenase